MFQNSQPAGAKSYYSKADYYTEGQELTGLWRGEGALLLGLEGNVKQAEWDALCDNRHPATGEQLTARTRQGQRSLTLCAGKDLCHEVEIPAAASALHGDAFSASMLLKQR